MSQLGFWNYAQNDPSKLGLVCPEGTEVSRGELLASCNQLVHGLRAAFVRLQSARTELRLG
jgi:long-chain acyl-CoA synthetase